MGKNVIVLHNKLYVQIGELEEKLLSIHTVVKSQGTTIQSFKHDPKKINYYIAQPISAIQCCKVTKFQITIFFYKQHCIQTCVPH